MRLPRPSRIILIAFAVTLPASPARADPLYNATALTNPGDPLPMVDGLNNNGQILLGNPWGAVGSPDYYIYNIQSGGTIPPFSMTNGSSPGGHFLPEAFNDNGQIIGSDGEHPLLYSGGQTTALLGWGQGINDSGQVTYVTGYGTYLNPDAAHIMDRNGTVHDLGTVPGYASTWVGAINNSGQAAAVGYHLTSDSGSNPTSQPLFYDGQHLIPLGTFGGPQGSAAGINNKGDVIGTAENAQGVLIPFVSHNGGPLISLGTLPGYADVIPSSINDSGQIVGLAGYNGTAAFLYQDGALTNLNSLLSPSASNINLLDAYAINNAGQIVAEGILKGEDKPQLFLLTPQGQPIPLSPDPLIASAPEPSTLAIFGLMLAGMVAHRWRRRPVDPQRDPSLASHP